MGSLDFGHSLCLFIHLSERFPPLRSWQIFAILEGQSGFSILHSSFLPVDFIEQLSKNLIGFEPSDGYTPSASQV